MSGGSFLTSQLKPKMKVAIDISAIIYPQFGVGTYLRELVRHLVAAYSEEEYLLFGYSLRAKASLESYLALFKGKPKVAAKIYPLPVSLLELLWNRFQLGSVDRLIGPVDLFHSSDWVQPPTDQKCLTTVHDLSPWRWPESFPPRIITNQKRRLAIVKKVCQLVIADSQATKHDLVEILDFDPQKIKVVYLGVDHQRFHPQLSALEIKKVLQKYQLHRPYLLALGARNPRKNIKRVVEGFRLAQKSYSELESYSLVVAGRFGWGEDLKPPKSVQFTGFIESEDLPALYAGAEIFLYPSFYEGFGLPVLEAMACGTPVITSRVSSLPEVGGEAASYVDPAKAEEIGEAIVKLVQSGREEKKRLKKSCLAQAANFSWPKCAQETMAVYQELMRS